MRCIIKTCCNKYLTLILIETFFRKNEKKKKKKKKSKGTSKVNSPAFFYEKTLKT